MAADSPAAKGHCQSGIMAVLQMAGHAKDRRYQRPGRATGQLAAKPHTPSSELPCDDNLLHCDSAAPRGKLCSGKCLCVTPPPALNESRLSLAREKSAPWLYPLKARCRARWLADARQDTEKRLFLWGVELIPLTQVAPLSHVRERNAYIDRSQTTVNLIDGNPFVKLAIPFGAGN